MSAKALPDAGLVPLSDRLRYMQVFRFTAAATAGVALFVLPDHRERALLPLVAVTAAYLVLALVTRQAMRLQRSAALRAFSASLLFDGCYLAYISYGTVGFGDPLQYLVLLHLVTVTLLASFRTGTKLALWHSLLATSVLQMQRDGLIRDPGASDLSPALAVSVLLAAIWMGTLFTATFAAVNERELRRRNYDLQALARLSWQLESALQPHEVGQALVTAIQEDFDIPRLALVTRSGDRLVPLAGIGVGEVDASLAPHGDKLLTQSLQERRTLRLASPKAEENPWLVRALPGVRNVLTIPLYADGRPLGVLVCENTDERGARIERRAVEMLERFVSQAALALANAWLLAQVRGLASSDGLTGVANRRTFDARLTAEIERSMRSGRPLSLALFDVDHFKRLNDTYGHQAGDEALKRVAATLQANARAVDFVARYGGEEFVVVLPDADLATAMEAAERLRLAVAELTTEPRVTASLGVATFPTNAENPALLVQAADEALYVSKQNGRNRTSASDRVPALTPAAMTSAAPGTRDTGAQAVPSPR